MSAPPAAIFPGDLKKYSKKELQELCLELQLNVNNSKGKKLAKDDLYALVKGHLFGSTDSSLTGSPKLALIYEEQKRNDDKKTKKTGKAKNSADRAADDLATRSKPAQVLTGANLTLHSQKVTTDPPPQFQPLYSQTNAEGNADTEAVTSENGSSPLSANPLTEEGDNTEEEEDKETEAANDDEDSTEEDPAINARMSTQGTVIVKFTNPHDQSYPASETFVHNVAIKNSVSATGGLKHEIDLRTLVPAVLLNLSPIKNDRTAKISRPGFTSENSKMTLGKVADLVTGKIPEELNFDRLNTMALMQDNEDFFCSLYYEPSKSSPTAPPLPTSLTGSASDRPLEIAQNRAAATPKQTQGTLTEEFVLLLRLSVGVDDALPFRKNKEALDALHNFRDFDTFFRKFAHFSNKGGYLIPADFTANERIQTKIPNWEIYRNTTFTKDHIIAAAGLKKSSTNEVHKLVSKGLKLEHDVAKYLRRAHLVESDAPGPDAAQDAAEIQALEAEYDDMPYKAFKALITQEVEEQQDNKPGPSKGAKGKGKAKRARSEDGSEGDEQRKRKENKRDTEADKTTKEIRRLEKRLNDLKAKKGDDMDSDDLD
ncbi:hypothetical protein DFH08DRAFT_963798 [Mycena albidolilacea]|uniref:Uncharacterized protein n=1 Tax=Mycena albidolilacea TaxID=1033008 RepID=A0AAD6ZU15_9AGAR|nr:hypothetical protein DFH08DRAFT_963798 [Mycena albidolilacea]